MSLTLARKGDSTKAVAERMAKNPPTGVPSTPLPNVTYGVGGVAIMAGGNIIGGLGVSGAPGAIRRGMCSWRSHQDRRSDEIGHLAGSIGRRRRTCDDVCNYCQTD